MVEKIEEMEEDVVKHFIEQALSLVLFSFNCEVIVLGPYYYCEQS
jgi:hypothetical protein